MLSVLHIENIALIEQADIRFDGGFNALTGETGAGKSIVIDAIGAVMGERTSRDLIRTGARTARVSALFTALPPLPWLAENGLGPDGNGELLLSRELHPDGKNLCRVNGTLCTVSQLKALGNQLVNIHGQHDGQQLLDEGSHLSYLDRFGGLTGELAAFGEAYQAAMALRRELEGLAMDEAERERRMDTLTYQIGELERAGLQSGEEESLTARRDVLRNIGRLTDAAEGAYGALAGDEQSEGAVGLLMTAEEHLKSGGRFSGELEELAEKAVEVRCAAQDVCELLRDLKESFDFSPGELDELEGRLDVLYRLEKKYGGSVEEMLEYLERCRAELDSMECAADTIARLEGEYDRALARARERGAALTAARKGAADALRGRIQRELEQLDMPKVRFEVEFVPRQGPIGMDADGMDQVRFLMSANLGEALKPIAKVASGGELARIMLALKNVLAEKDDVTTLIFDEVDTGISGRAAQRVAEKLAAISRHAQVLCVTHLPQLAAMADTHFTVEKGERDGRTYTAVTALDAGGRGRELARLTSGERIGPAAMESAAELLRQAEEYKSAWAPSRKGDKKPRG